MSSVRVSGWSGLLSVLLLSGLLVACGDSSSTPQPDTGTSDTSSSGDSGQQGDTGSQGDSTVGSDATPDMEVVQQGATCAGEVPVSNFQLSGQYPCDSNKLSDGDAITALSNVNMVYFLAGDFAVNSCTGSTLCGQGFDSGEIFQKANDFQSALQAIAVQAPASTVEAAMIDLFHRCIKNFPNSNPSATDTGTTPIVPQDGTRYGDWLLFSATKVYRARVQVDITTTPGVTDLSTYNILKASGIQAQTLADVVGKFAGLSGGPVEVTLTLEDGSNIGVTAVVKILCMQEEAAQPV